MRDDESNLFLASYMAVIAGAEIASTVVLSVLGISALQRYFLALDVSVPSNDDLAAQLEAVKNFEGAPEESWDILVCESKAKVADKMTAIRALEAKAATQLGIVITLMGAIAIFGEHVGSRTSQGLWYILAVLALLVAFAFDVLTLFPRERDTVRLQDYLDLKFLGSSVPSTRVKSHYTARLLHYSRKLARQNKSMARLQEVALYSLGVAVLLLLINAYVAQSISGSSYDTTCRNQSGALKCHTQQQ